MYTAEHLDLVTSVSDDFTEDLARLSGLLETVGQQADALDPIRIRVDVDDSQLSNLQRKLAQTQGMRLGFARSSRPSVGDGDEQNVPDEISNPLRHIKHNTDVLSDVGDSEPTIGRGTGGLAAGALMTQLNSLNNSVTDFLNAADGGDDEGGAGRVIPEQLIQEFDGIPIEPFARDRRVNPMAMLRGESPFGFPTDELEEILSPAAFTRALEEGSLAAELDMDSDDILPRLSRMSQNELLEVFGADSMRGVFRTMARNTDETSLRLGSLKQAIVQSRVGMTQFYDILAASIPLLLGVVAALPAAIGGIAALGVAALGAAGALAGIAGLGLIGAAQAQSGGGFPSLEDVREVFDGLGEDFLESFRPLTREFAPLFEDAVDNAGSFFDELARSSRVLTQLTDDARAFADFTGTFLAGTIEALGRFADAARPVFTLIAEGLANRDITGGLANALADTLPQLTRLTSMLADALPVAVDISAGVFGQLMGVLRGIEMSISILRTALNSTIGTFFNTDRAVGAFIGSLLTLSSAALLVSNVTRLLTSTTLQYVAALLYQQVVQSGALLSLTKYIGGLATYITTTAKATAVTALFTKALASLLALTGVGVVLVGFSGAVSLLADEFLGLNENITDATDSLREFERQRSSMGSRGNAFVGELGRDVYIDVTETNEYTVKGNMDQRTQERQSFVPQSQRPDTLG